MNKLISITIITFLIACNSKNDAAKILTVQPNTLIKTPVQKSEDPIEGIYTALTDSNNDNGCNITLELIKTGKGYQYSLKTDKKNIKGNARLVDNSSDEQYIVLENLPWDEYEGDISNEEDAVSTKEVEIPTQIDFLYKNDTLSLQNYGNAMNYYTKLGECGAKYIQLVKK